MKKEELREILRYIIVGVLTTIVSLGTYFILTNTLFPPERQINIQIATILSWIISVSFAFIANRIVVFKSKESNVKKEALKFFLARISTLLIDSLSMYILTDLFKLNDRLSKIMVQFIILCLNYILSKFAVFKKVD